LMRAVIRDNQDGRIVATGTAFERKDNPSSMVNKTSHVENCETSAWGRALGNFGIGIDAAVASADEVRNAVLDGEQPQQKSEPVKKAPPPRVPPKQPAKAAAKPEVPTAIKVMEHLNAA